MPGRAVDCPMTAEGQRVILPAFKRNVTEISKSLFVKKMNSHYSYKKNTKFAVEYRGTISNPLYYRRGL